MTRALRASGKIGLTGCEASIARMHDTIPMITPLQIA